MTKQKSSVTHKIVFGVRRRPIRLILKIGNHVPFFKSANIFHWILH